MPCITDAPSISFEKYLEEMFKRSLYFLTEHQINSLSVIDNITEKMCKVCKMLTKKQMRILRDDSGYIGIFQWYAEHLIGDYSKNYSNTDETEKKVCLQEVERLDLILEKDSNYNTVFSIRSKSSEDE